MGYLPGRYHTVTGTLNRSLGALLGAHSLLSAHESGRRDRHRQQRILAVDQRMEPNTGATSAFHRDVGDFGDLPAPFRLRQDSLAVIAGEWQRSDDLVAG